MRALLLLLLPAVAFAQVREDRVRALRIGRSAAASSQYAYFEFAPASGAGLGAACACSAVTGAKGEAVTLTRSSNGWCTKASETTGIVNGDLVECSSNLPRIMPGGDGTGGLGLLVEPSRTNEIIRSQDLENAAWATSGSAITITADFATAPDGTLTADRLQIPAISAGGESVRYDVVTTAASSASVYLKGTSGSGTLDMYNNGFATDCVTCSFNSTTWTRCVNEDTATNGGTILAIGNESAGGTTCPSGQGAKGAVDVLVWGAQVEAGTTVSSYIKTAGTATTRTADTASVPVSWTGTKLYASATWQARSAIASNVGLHLYKDANNSTKVSVASTKVRGTFRIGGVDGTQDSVASVTVSASNRLGAYYDLSNKAGCLAGTCTTASASLTLPTGSQTLYLGHDQGGSNQLNGVVKLVCLDPFACAGAP